MTCYTFIFANRPPVAIPARTLAEAYAKLSEQAVKGILVNVEVRGAS